MTSALIHLTLLTVMSFEEEFDIEIPDDQVEKIKTVGDIVKFIEEKVED